eukprot:TRINITY_DN4311_c0_g1_i3.p3 TRINITY_DN4311_c0_g1~~TRINITY_DN4311_c0_g1_i3.p3  ORF type:complete len:109 (+),score=7.01 TRINITY_DN4311_c0_g1_i3:698-1024(+)
MKMGMVDIIISDIHDPDLVRTLGQNASYFLSKNSNFVISINANRINPTLPDATVYANVVDQIRKEMFKPSEQLTLEPYEKCHAVLMGTYQPTEEQLSHKEQNHFINSF